jgi:hypothetical protein
MARTSSSEREAKVLAAYRTKPPAVRRAMAVKASPELRALLARIERSIAMAASPGALAAVLSERREMQARHLHLIDQRLRVCQRHHFADDDDGRAADAGIHHVAM